ncbi:YczE/YyaS/YitT family protein [Herbiconiux daphne]|uniref:YczE/YyaS/YitT family protein n=1 Tax=Herbiconiux daphne TaxID=2970914 RepID=UPI0038B407FE
MSVRSFRLFRVLLLLRVPRTPGVPRALRVLRLLAGLVLYGFADSLIIRASIGVEPWTVLAQGVAERTGWSIGILTNVIGLGVLLLWIPLRQRPGLGTVLNVLVVGTSIDLGLRLVPPVESWAGTGSGSAVWSSSSLWSGSLWSASLWSGSSGSSGASLSMLGMQVGLFVAGLLLLAVASGIYIGADLGPGPRDGLMTGIRSRFGWPIWLGRGVVEGSVLLVGWLLGGDVGIGTLVFALAIGPLCAVTLPLFGAVPRASGSPASRSSRSRSSRSRSSGSRPRSAGSPSSEPSSSGPSSSGPSSRGSQSTSPGSPSSKSSRSPVSAPPPSSSAPPALPAPR